MNPNNITRPQTEKVGVIYGPDGPVNDNCNWSWFTIILIVILVIIIVFLLCYLLWCYFCPSVGPCVPKEVCTPRTVKVSRGGVEYEYCLARAIVRTCDPELTYVTEYVQAPVGVPQNSTVVPLVNKTPQLQPAPVFERSPVALVSPVSPVTATPVPTAQPVQAPIIGVETQIPVASVTPSQTEALPPPVIIAPRVPPTLVTPTIPRTLTALRTPAPTYTPTPETSYEINSPIDSLTAQYV
ncbi:MAG: hypothetical protein Solivirus9_3 [Solivirus sp.]|uniref:Uncharacterized protein n=1 Tax=Solivirus sp. TaxID=2487772 RepID=A0A3G5AG30_9VIRU|nr:MAG: hypothetical protein Solivirus9_3 [Solivirus sp.]